MSETVEIRSVLRLDDRSKEVVEKAKEGYEHLGEKVHEVQHELASMFKQSLAVAAGFQLDHGIESIKELGHEVFEAAQNLGNETKGLTGAIAIGDKAGRSYEQIKAQASELHEELEGLAIKAGASTGSIVEMFTTIQSRSNRSIEATKELTENMVYASRAIPGGMDALAGSFRDLESGIIRPRNQLVQMMVMTGTVKGSAREVAKGLSAMFQAGRGDEVLEMADAAIGRMSDKMKQAPMSFGQVVASLKAVRESAFESMGMPMLRAMTPPLLQLQKYFVDHRKELEHWAHAAGEKVGQWVTAAADKMKEGFQYLQNHAKEIKEAIESAVKTAKAVVEWIVDHREMIAMAFGAKMAAGPIKSAIGMATDGVGMVRGIAAAGAPSLGMAGGGALAFGVTIAAFAAAVGAWKVATDQWAELQKLTHGKSDAQQNEEARKARIDELGGTAEKVDAGEFDRLRAKFVEQSDAMSMTGKAAGEYADQLWAQHRALRAQADQLDEVGSMADRGNELNAASIWTVVYDNAVQSHNQAIQEYAAKVLAGNQTLQNAFLTSGAQVEGGYDHLAELLAGKSEEFAKIVKGMGSEAGKGKLPDKLAVNFNGGQTFHVKQEFRDGDPDRVLVAFKRDLVRTAVNRMQSRVGTPFGL